MSEILTEQISKSLSINKKQVAAAVELLNAGATIPFISRYRKEAQAVWMKCRLLIFSQS